jgi:signal transduction histidine kinase/GAF domain-containing protein/ActR/RegA family two-component response regulator
MPRPTTASAGLAIAERSPGWTAASDGDSDGWLGGWGLGSLLLGFACGVLAMRLARDRWRSVWSPLARRGARPSRTGSDSDLAAILRSTPEALEIVDFDGTVLFVNAAGVEFARRFDHRSTVGRRSLLFTTERADRDAMRELLRRVGDGSPCRRLVRILARPSPTDSGSVEAAVARTASAWIEVQAMPYRPDGEQVAPTGIVLCLRDVTSDVSTRIAAAFASEVAEVRARVSGVLASGDPLPRRVRAALGIVVGMKELRHRRRASLLVTNEGLGTLDLFAHVGPGGGLLVDGPDGTTVPPSCRRALVARHPIVLDRCPRDGVCDLHAPDLSPHGHYVVPLLVDDHCLGILLLDTDVEPANDERRLAEFLQIGTQLATAIVRDRMQRELDTTAERLQRAMATAGVGVWEHDPVRGTVVWSDTMYALHAPDGVECPIESVTSVDAWCRLLDPDDEASLRGVLTTNRSASDGGVQNEVIVHVGSDFRRRYLRVVAGLDATMPGPPRIVGACQDVTEREMRALALMSARNDADLANQAKSDFLANMSHEIRTPMTAILGYAELLEDADPEVVDDGPRVIRRNAEYLLGLINDILDLSKIEAGHMTVESVPTCLRELVDGVERLMVPRARAKGIELRVRFGETLPQAVSTDPMRVRQVLINLLGNAIKFTERGHVDLAVSSIPCTSGSDLTSLRFEVRDTGIGMTEEQLSAIRKFEAFRQADASTSRRFGGTGLGLRISSSLASLLGGGLLVESTAGEGSVFTLTFATTCAALPDPAAHDDHGKPTDEISDTRSGDAAPLAALRILVADDGPDNRRLVSHFLRRAGARVEVAADGREAVDAVLGAQEPFDLVLMDMQMPELDGYDATRQLRRRGFAGPVVALTGNAMDGDEDRCRNAGCDGYLTKPIDRRQLVEQVRRTAHRGSS